VVASSLTRSPKLTSLKLLKVRPAVCIAPKILPDAKSSAKPKPA
ncbi:uncharacterized protein METZ01_LOCUS469268, partial [marine metagenome]